MFRRCARSDHSITGTAGDEGDRIDRAVLVRDVSDHLPGGIRLQETALKRDLRQQIRQVLCVVA